MDSRVTKALAGFFLLGALGAAYWGVRLSQPTPVAEPLNTATQAPVRENVTLTPVVVAAKDLAPYTPLKPEDLKIEQVENPAPGSVSRLDQVVGSQLWLPHQAGKALTEADVESAGGLARMIRPDERAMAILIDEVVGAAGFVQPGDFVDVLLVINDGNQDERIAQVALPALRLLSYGETLGVASSEKSSGGDSSAASYSPRSASRTAVLAVPQEWAPRLLLATQAGTIRLAVRSADEQLMARYRAGESMPVALDESTRAVFPLSELGGAKPKADQPQANPTQQRGDPAGAKRGVEVLRGGVLSIQNP